MAIEHDRSTDETFDRFLFVPGTYAGGTPFRLRVVDDGLGIQILEEDTTSESVSAETLLSRANTIIDVTPEQVRWLHRTLGDLLARLESAQ